MTRTDATRSSTPDVASGAAALGWAAVDVLLILVFAASGRRTHEHGVTIAGVLDTAWPFIAAYVLAALLLQAWRSPSAVWPTGVVLGLATVGGGLGVRAVSGAGVALSFQVVTLLVLGVFLLAPRAVALTLRRRRRRVA
ncbi:DUF3054 domain-containing protein [Arthrobacter agilis]|uniref:DUF3054 domain-containing protein n=1 Tax=Arthrobacter agilis TaxID=37921 RepID=UPI000B357BB7|nr:DUF3054 domain-containing protein [Arthrobacter agilis]OUM44442.1 hypothetical protein B8W74_02985 [Arthrobacter agilis]PPB47346.1 DUF3054 domain-containing protein [Arthrobacter agilis]TPV22864.1 DUF3054 domain-containing protein [Arthrobacter agilis]VDR32117.1 Protein of uncharacterised function (DUF3054) [Arthrobacter agilis]